MSNYNVAEQPLEYAIYKSKAALRMRLVNPRIDNSSGRDVLNKGFVFLEMAPIKEGSGNQKQYEWEQKKIGVKLGMPDLAQIVYSMKRGQEAEMFHEFDGSTKVIKLTRATEGKSPYFISVSQNNGGVKSQCSIPVSGQEAEVILNLVSYAIPKILNW
jgi:hypothetical protein